MRSDGQIELEGVTTADANKSSGVSPHFIRDSANGLAWTDESPTEIKLSYHRIMTVRALYACLALALPLLYLTPIVALCVLSAGGLALYWLVDTIRFHHGGDMRKCSHRDCSLSFFLMIGSVAWIICVFATGALIADFSSGSTATESSDLHSNAIKLNSWQHVCALIDNCFMVPTLAFVLLQVFRIRRLLEYPHEYTHVATREEVEDVEDDEV
jgi:hypothetical protein